MDELGDGAEQRRLWRLWRALPARDAAPPDALMLAAYAEGRLDEEAAETVENWLAADLDRLADVEAARALALAPALSAEGRLVARASALVDPATGKVVSFRRPQPAGWRSALAWTSVAASLVVTSLAGFAMGSDTYRSLTRTQTAESVPGDAFEAGFTLDYDLPDDSGT